MVLETDRIETFPRVIKETCSSVLFGKVKCFGTYL